MKKQFASRYEALLQEAKKYIFDLLQERGEIQIIENAKSEYLSNAPHFYNYSPEDWVERYAIQRITFWEKDTISLYGLGDSDYADGFKIMILDEVEASEVIYLADYLSECEASGSFLIEHQYEA
jgi:hypothetical protein